MGFIMFYKLKIKILNLLEYIVPGQAYDKLGFELKGFWIKIISN